MSVVLEQLDIERLPYPLLLEATDAEMLSLRNNPLTDECVILPSLFGSAISLTTGPQGFTSRLQCLHSLGSSSIAPGLFFSHVAI